MFPVAIVVEHDERSRRVLTRLLEECGVDTVHAPDDVSEATALLTEARVTSALVIVSEPDQSQLASLMKLRDAAAGTHLSLLVTTCRPTVRLVQELASIGVRDVFRRPLHVDAVRRRLAEACHRLVIAGLDAPPLLTPGSTVLLVDGEPAYCRLLAAQAATWRAVTSAASGVDALAMTAATPPQAVFVGEGIGCLNPARFIDRLRERKWREGIRLFLLTRTGAAPTRELAAHIDAVLPRTWSPALIRQTLSRFVHAA